MPELLENSIYNKKEIIKKLKDTGLN